MNTINLLDIFQVTGRGRAERYNIADSFVESRICTLLVNSGLILVLQIILDVAHLVMRSQQIFHVDPRALFNPEILAVVEVPGARVADHFATLLLLQDRPVPK